jgi:hypothetical protein
MWSTLKIVAHISYVDDDRSIFSVNIDVNANSLSLALTIVDTTDLNIIKKKLIFFFRCLMTITVKPNTSYCVLPLLVVVCFSFHL